MATTLSSTLARRIFAPRLFTARTTPVLRKNLLLTTYRAQCISTQSLPIVAQPGFWKSMVPKFMRGGQSSHETGTGENKRKGWNPATFFIVIFLLIGSQAIQMISLHRSYDRFSHETDAKLNLLREVIQRVQSGEDVDVEAMLGTGNKAKEKEWDESTRYHTSAGCASC